MFFKGILLSGVIISQLVAVPTAQEKFDAADSNKDKVLSLDEFYNDQARKMDMKIKQGKALKGAATAPSFESVDKNSDGKITFEEYDVFHTERQKYMDKIKNQTPGSGKGFEFFNKYDTNKNGCIDKEEFKTLYQDIQKK